MAAASQSPEAAKIRERLAWFVTDAPLYHRVSVLRVWQPVATAAQILPPAVTMPCERCGIEAANWDRVGGELVTVGSLTEITYACRNCVGEGKAFVQISFWWRYA